MRKFPPDSNTQSKDSTIIETRKILKDTTVFIQIPADTVYIEKKGEVNENGLSIDTTRIENEFSQAIAWVNNSILGLKLIQKKQTIEKKLSQAIREVEHWKRMYSLESNLKRTVEVKEVEVIKEVKVIPKFYKFTLYFFIVIASGAVAFIIYTALKIWNFLPF